MDTFSMHITPGGHFDVYIHVKIFSKMIRHLDLFANECCCEFIDIF